MKINILIISFISASLFMVSIVYFLNQVQSYEAPIEKEKLDAIIVLTGGAKRIDEGLKLLKENYGQKLLVSGIYNRVSFDDQHTYPIRLKKFRSKKITLDTLSTTTKENAENSRLWMIQHNIHSIYLVTEQFHIPRSLLEFKRTMPNLRVIPWPVTHYNIYEKLNDSNGNIFRLVLTEYFKFFGAFIIIKIESFLHKGI